MILFNGQIRQHREVSGRRYYLRITVLGEVEGEEGGHNFHHRCYHNFQEEQGDFSEVIIAGIVATIADGRKRMIAAITNNASGSVGCENYSYLDLNFNATTYPPGTPPHHHHC